jgi:hypothetical protein
MSTQYLDSLIQNNYLRDESTNLDTETENMKGGGNIVVKQPTGGFPPIFKCIREQIIKEEEQKNRLFATKKTAVSIKEIMQQRRDETPFSL